MKTIEIYTLRAYRSVHDFIEAPESYHAASYHENIEDVPVGGWARQDGSFEVTLKVTVLAGVLILLTRDVLLDRI